MKNFQQLLSEHVCLSILKQQAMSSLLGEHSWNVDVTKGEVDFGEGKVFPIQIIGTESEKDGTWLWAWANTQSNLPQNLLMEVNKLRSYGEENQIINLTESEIPLSEQLGHEIGMIASGFCNADAYYHGGIDSGAIVFLIYKTDLPKTFELQPQQIVMTIASVLQNFEVEHRTMVSSFLKQLGYETEETDKSIAGKLSDGMNLVVGFDDLGRIINIEIKQSDAE